MGTRAPLRRDDQDATDRRDAARVEPRLPSLPNGAGRQPALSPQLLSALGNQAVQRALVRPASWGQTPPIQRVDTKPAKDLLDMTVGEFDEHRKTDQADWANATGFDEATRQAVWQIVDWGLDGLSEIKLGEAAKEVAKKTTIPHLENYCEALTGKVGGKVTIELTKVSTIADAVREGKWIANLTATLGEGTMRAVMPVEVFRKLIADETVAKALVDYYTAYNPTFQAPTGKDTTAFIDLVGKEKGKISDYAALTSVRNYHKFYKASLDKLNTDLSTAGKPLTLVFQALHDHNGAFIQHAHVNKVIQNSNIRAFLLEGRDEAQLKGLGQTGIQQIAKTYGVDGKITQVLFAGHGDATMMQMGGGGVFTGTKKSGEWAIGEEDHKDLSFAQDDAFWTTFFEALLSNMEMKGGLKPTILLRACLTASNEVDTDKLKKELKDTGVIDVDDTSIDPTTDENQKKIREGIVKYIKAHGSLATVAGDKAAGRAEVLGAQASISSATTGSIDESTGQLQIVAITDPKVAAPKIEYVREGKEPLGCIRAVIESWAQDRDKCFATMNERLKDAVASDDEFIIQLLFRTIINVYAKDIITANGFTGTANALHGIAAGGAECRVSALRGDDMTQKHRKDFYPLLVGRFADKLAKLVIYEDWMDLDNAKRTDFVDLLGDPSMTRAGVTNYLDFKTAMAAHVAPILKLSGVSARGKIIFALVGAIEAKDADCQTFLKTQVDSSQAFTKDVKDALGGYSERTLRTLVGLPVETVATVPSSSSGPTGRPQNIAGGTFHVESMPATRMKMTKSTIGDWAKLMSEPNDNSTVIDRRYRNQMYDVVGKVTDLTGADAGWYMLKQDGGTIGYMRTKYF
jgi:hypothetical protein